VKKIFGVASVGGVNRLTRKGGARLAGFCSVGSQSGADGSEDAEDDEVEGRGGSR
jgi:hypothetical protein